jgi:2-dehydropantoate 2-reductase
MINPLTAILQLKNGELLSNPYAYELLVSLHKELLHAFPEMNTSLSLEAVEMVCEKTATNHSSMLVDRLNGNQMEIETIVTAVIQKANRKGFKLPTLEKLERMLLALDWRDK